MHSDNFFLLVTGQFPVFLHPLAEQFFMYRSIRDEKSIYANQTVFIYPEILDKIP